MKKKRKKKKKKKSKRAKLRSALPVLARMRNGGPMTDSREKRQEMKETKFQESAEHSSREIAEKIDVE